MADRDITFRLGEGEIRLSVPPPYEPGIKWSATEDLERLVETLIAAVKASGGTVTQGETVQVAL